MSKEINVKFENASQEIMVVGAEALGLAKGQAEGSYHLPNGQTMQITDGRVKGNFYMMGGRMLGEHKVTSSSEDGNAQETIGVIRRAGLTATVATHLVNEGFDAAHDVAQGTVSAARRDETISIRVGLDGLMHSDLGGFEGDACSMTMQKLLDKLPSHQVESETPKTQPTHVMRTQE